jgi:hypothetical protein
MAERPVDLGEEVSTIADLVVGQTYYYYFGKPLAIETRTGELQQFRKLTVLRIISGNIVVGTDDTGKLSMPTWNAGEVRNHFFRIDPTSSQRAIGELLTMKLPSLSTAPGTGPANIVRGFVGVQPPPRASGGGRKRRTRRRR